MSVISLLCHTLCLHEIQSSPVGDVGNPRFGWSFSFLIHLLHHSRVTITSHSQASKLAPTKSHKRAGGEASIGRHVTASERNVDKLRRVIQCESLCQLLEPICHRTAPRAL